MYDYGFRIYNPRIGKFLSVDPLQKQYPQLTPHQFASNSPIQGVDLDGREIFHYTMSMGNQGETILYLQKTEEKVEFAQMYTAGTGKNGGGGFYTLYFGTKNNVNVPVAPNSFLIDHTHPGGTTSPSIFDINYLIKAQQEGSPQKSSVIIPSGGAPVRFNKTTPANGQE